MDEERLTKVMRLAGAAWAAMGAGRSSFTALKDARVRRGSETSAFSERSL